MRTIKRAVHLDFHTLPGIYDFGSNFNAADFAKRLKASHVDYINMFAKCNIGYTYYPSDVGIVYPGLSFDLFGQVLNECHKEGIGVSAYFNIGLDHEMARKRRDWCVLNKNGQVIFGDRTANFFRVMCLNSGYREYMLSMIGEVVKKYPVDGVFLDCLVAEPCYGDECAELIVQNEGDPLDDPSVGQCARQTLIDFCWEVKGLLDDDMLFVPNGLSHTERVGMASHTEIECLPGEWGYDYFSAHAAFARTLAIPAVYMTGRFHASWGDFGGLKQKASLEYDAWDAVSNGVAFSVGDHLHPRDGLETATYERVKEVNRAIELLDPWADGFTNISDIGVVMPPLSDFGANTVRFQDGQEVLYAAARMLGELKYTFDIVLPTGDFSKYKCLILPDYILIDGELREKLASFLKSGRGIISSGVSGLDETMTGFSLPDWKMTYDGLDASNMGYFRMHDDSQPDSRICAIYKPGIQLGANSQTETIADYYQPYFDRKWDGFHGYFYTPPEKPNGRPALARSGNIFQFSFKVFADYRQYAMPEHRHLLGSCLTELVKDPIAKVEGLPSTARLTVSKKQNTFSIHVKVTYPELRGKYNIIEEHNEVSEAVVFLRTRAATAVYSAPSRTPLPFKQVGDYIRVELPRIVGYLLVVVETDAAAEQ